MLPGINEDLVRGNRTYHVQTEDRGHRNPSVVTVLFLEGAVLTSDRVSYKDLLGHDDRIRELKKLMIRQHRGVLRRILAGEFDDTDIVGARAPEAEPILPLEHYTEAELVADDDEVVEPASGLEEQPTLPLPLGADDAARLLDGGEARLPALGLPDASPEQEAPFGFCAGVITERPLSLVIMLHLDSVGAPRGGAEA